MTKYFPVIHSILSPEALSGFLSSEYALDNVQYAQYLNQGVNDTYRVHTNAGDFIFRLYQYGRHTKEDLLFEMDAISFLSGKSIPIAKPIAKSITDKSNHFVQEIPCPEGIRYGVLFEYAPGSAPRKFLTQKQSYILGRNIARLHQVGLGFQSTHLRADIGCQNLITTAISKIEPFFKTQPNDFDYLQQAASRVLNAIQNLPSGEPYWTLCAGDVHAGNLHFTPDNQMTLFDFDQCGFGHRSFEIGKFLYSCQNQNIPDKVQQAFLNGYQEVALLNAEEIRAFAPLQMLAHLWVLGVNAEVAPVFPSNRFSRQYFDKKLKALKELEKNLAL